MFMIMLSSSSTYHYFFILFYVYPLCITPFCVFLLPPPPVPSFTSFPFAMCIFRYMYVYVCTNTHVQEHLSIFLCLSNNISTYFSIYSPTPRNLSFYILTQLCIRSLSNPPTRPDLILKSSTNLSLSPYLALSLSRSLTTLLREELFEANGV